MMKRHGNLFSKIVEPANIYLAYRHARKGKSWQNTIKLFEADSDKNLDTIRASILDKTFTTSEYETFMVYEPKRRIIYKLPFNPDRIVQHALMNVVEPIFDGLFIHDSYSCRKGKGIHAGSRRTMEYIRKVGKDGYCLKMDIAKFYPSISHNILYEIVKHKIKCKDTLWLLKDIIYSIEGGYNIPIGNYTSQWFGNLYMNELDQVLKQKYHVKNYIRYCDDFIILDEEKTYLTEVAEIIKEYLKDQLELKLSKNVVSPVKQGIDFLGYRHFPTYVLLRKSTATRTKRRIKQLPTLLSEGAITELQFKSSIASTKGWLRWCNAYNLSQHLNLNQMVVDGVCCHAR